MVKSYLLGNIAEGIRDHSLFLYIWRVGWKKSYRALEFFLPKSKYLEKYYFNPFAPEPSVTARADPGPFYPL